MQAIAFGKAIIPHLKLIGEHAQKHVDEFDNGDGKITVVGECSSLDDLRAVDNIMVGVLSLAKEISCGVHL